MNSKIKIKKDSFYVFTFGNVGVGKSTMLASLVQTIRNSGAILRVNIKNEFGTKYLYDEWINTISKGVFPSRTPIGRVVEIDIGIESNSMRLPLTFCEISGEDLKSIDLTSKLHNYITFNILDYISKSDCFIIMTSVDYAGHDDFFLSLFFEHLIKQKDCPLLFVISKWDLMKEEVELKDFMEKNMPLTFSWMKSKYMKNKKILTFTVGHVLNDKIEVFNYQ